MTQVSKYPVSKDVYDRVFDLFIETVVSLKLKEEAKNFFDDYLSPTERVMLAKRLAVAILLKKKYQYREISKILRVSTSMINTVSLSLKFRGTFDKIVEKVVRKEELKGKLLDSSEKVLSVLSSANSKSGSWTYLRDEVTKENRKRSLL